MEFHINNLTQIKKDTLAIGDGEVRVRRICAGGLNANKGFIKQESNYFAIFEYNWHYNI